jgi:transposase InsO family protein
MEGSERVERKRKRIKRGKRYSAEEKLKIVKLQAEEGYSVALLCQEFGVSDNSLYSWKRRYREAGAAGLAGRRPGPSAQTTSSPLQDTILETKRRHPDFGVRKVSQFLRRVLFVGACPETVRRVLGRHGLVGAEGKGRQRNVLKPRFFERTTPNQLWQSDIFMFRLGGQQAYLIGYIDDYSRYMISLILRRSQTAAQVVEAYRRGTGEYGVPQEMLTDNGRQYTNWRGGTRFEKELARDKVKHIKSRPHHPMTLGKIERFWATIYHEFLERARFGSFEEAEERIKVWVQYYNHRRPHQGIGGLCPADRYFEIAHELRKTIEAGIAENALELALRGKPKDPLYLVGRLDGQSVVLRAEKGRLQLTVHDEMDHQTQELIHELEQGVKSDEREGQTAGSSNPEGTTRGDDNGGGRGSTGGVAEDLLRVAGTCPGGHADGLGGPACGPAGDAGRPGEGNAGSQKPGVGAGVGSGQADRGSEACAAGLAKTEGQGQR